MSVRSFRRALLAGGTAAVLVTGIAGVTAVAADAAPAPGVRHAADDGLHHQRHGKAHRSSTGDRRVEDHGRSAGATKVDDHGGRGRGTDDAKGDDHGRHGGDHR